MQAPDDRPVIEVEDLRYTYPGADRPAVDGLTFAVGRGEIFGFLGPNGSGKSTTQKILIGLLSEYEGRVEISGRPLGDWGRELYERVGVAFEFPNHYLKLTGSENLTYFRSLYGGPTAEPDELLERVGLGADGAMPVGQYSKGMKSRLSFARALLPEPELLFLDEPTSGLDPVGGRRIKGLIREQKEAGRTVFLTTHDMTVAAELCDRVAFLVDGAIALIDAPHALALRYGEPRVRIEYLEDGAPQQHERPLAGLGDDPEFLRLLREGQVQTIHTLEATLEDVFVRVTGRSLA